MPKNRKIGLGLILIQLVVYAVNVFGPEKGQNMFSKLTSGNGASIAEFLGFSILGIIGVVLVIKSFMSDNKS